MEKGIAETTVMKNAPAKALRYVYEKYENYHRLDYLWKRNAVILAETKDTDLFGYVAWFSYQEHAQLCNVFISKQLLTNPDGLEMELRNRMKLFKQASKGKGKGEISGFETPSEDEGSHIQENGEQTSMKGKGKDKKKTKT